VFNNFNIKNLNLFILSSLIFSIKPLEFLSSNIIIANFTQDLIFPILFHLFIYTNFLIFFLLTLKFKKTFFDKIFLLIATLYYLQFFINDLNHYIDLVIPFDISNSFIQLISLFVIVIISFIFNILYFLSKNKSLFILVAFIICITQILLIIVKIIYNYGTEIDYQNNISTSVDEEYNKNEIKNLNVYYVILDGLTSYNYFSKEIKTEHKRYKEFNSNLEKLNFRIFDNSFSSYNSTYLTLASIFEMKYFDENIIYNNRDNFFPNILYEEIPPNLILKLNEIGYEFLYSGNSEIKCFVSKNFTCIPNSSNIESKNILSKFLFFTKNPGIQTFIRNSLINSILTRLSYFFDLVFDNDALDNFTFSVINDIKPDNKKFYFIHNLAPHPPYPDDDCVIKVNKSLVNWGTVDDYSKSITCVFNKTDAFINKILKKDPNAIIIIQADHGPNFNYDFSINPLLLNRHSLKEKFSIHNSIKLPPKCDFIETNSLGNVETINLIFNCLVNKQINRNPLNSSFAGVFEDSDFFGKLLDVTSKLK
jgi:hypothetical protein